MGDRTQRGNPIFPDFHGYRQPFSNEEFLKCQKELTDPTT
jgi:pyrimidine operon attenuation protein/uracil phosphoribosyltransferase